MNVSGFNSAPINSAVLDTTVRVAVTGSALATGFVGGRVRARLFAAQVATAAAVVQARKGARHASTRTAQAVLTGKHSVCRRLLINGLAAAQSSVLSNRVLLRVSVSALASAVVLARAFRRNPATRSDSVQAVLTSHKGARNRVASSAVAQTAYNRRVLARSPMPVNGLALSAVTPRAARRSGVSESALAMGFVGAHTTIFYPYDEPAPEESTFYVPYENNLFYVEAGMTIIATISPQPRDIKDTDINFSEYFPAGDLLIAAAVSVEPAGLIVGYALQGMVVKVWTRGGVSGTKYKVTILGSSSDGRAKEVEMIVKVKEK